MLLEDFNRTIDIWIRELDKYTYTELMFRPLTGWSLGQLYMHLITDTSYYLGEMKTCIATKNHSEKEASAYAKALFKNKCFPDEAIPGDPSNIYIKQPETKAQLLDGLKNLKKEFNELYTHITANSFEGKTEHPGLGYFSALEWAQFAEMHFKHHLRQKKRIDSSIRA